MSTDTNRVSSGVPGLNDILQGGFLPHHNALIRGPPGAGKTTVGLHFLEAGVANGESVLFINLGEPAEYIRRAAEEFGLTPDEYEFLDLAPSDDQFSAEETYSLFSAAEVEQPGLVGEIRSAVEDHDPERVFVDPITELRYLTADERQFRIQISSFLEFLRENGTSVLLTSQAAETMPDDDLQFLTDAVIDLELYEEWRSLGVTKFRGSSFIRGRHAYEISSDGVSVFPALVLSKSDQSLSGGTHTSGVPELDKMLHGGLDEGTISMLSGPTGVGKTTTGLQFLKESAGRGQEAIFFSFEESPKTILHRANAINIPIDDMLDRGTLRLEEVVPNAITVDEFANSVKDYVENDDVSLVMIDGIEGFKQNLRGLSDDPADDLVTIGRYLRNQGVSIIYTEEVHEITGRFRATEERTSNLADNVLFLRHVEFNGKIRKVIGVLKKRTSDFDTELRELEITEHGLRVGDPLPQLRGILTGTPEWDDSA